MEQYSTIKTASNENDKKVKEHRFFINQKEKNKIYKHKNNTITQTKYNIITFLPKALLYQFFRLANVYFLFIAIIQLIPQISPLSPTTAVVPLAFVLCISLIREAIEDYSRYKFDKQLNTEPAFRFRDKWENVDSGNLDIGDIIMVTEENPFPADMLVLDSNLKDGLCFIETGTLDGEKTLKNKEAAKQTSGLLANDNSDKDEKTWKSKILIQGECYGDLPNPDLYKFNGFVSLNISEGETKQEISFVSDAKQMLLKGAILKNTKWVIGIVLYTGHNTKLILNSKKSSIKYSRIETLMSKLLIFILFLQCILCIICAIANSVYYTNYVIFAFYLPKALYSATIDATLSYFTYNLLLNTLIPISLIISLEIAKLIQGYFISVDYRLYSHLRDKFVKANSISLNEELGQVDYIFSDKTGTLTCNKMLFKFCVIGDTCYEYNKDFGKGVSYEEESKKLREQMSIKEIGPNFFENYSFTNGGRTKSKIYSDNYNQFSYGGLNENTYFNTLSNDTGIITEFWKALVTAHECNIEEKDKKISYSGLSPDDIELLNSAREQGFTLVPGDNNKRTIINKDKTSTFEILKIIEFSSDRKRMSIIIKDGDEMKMFMKGADSEIIKRINKQSGNQSHLDIASYYVNYFSLRGYRTLLIGVKIIDEKVYQKFLNDVKEAGKDIKTKEVETEKIYDAFERDIYLLGATIVEDKLQDQVPETIRDLRLAKIKIWMLTGDKFNTAKNIGLSCNLISNDMKLFTIKGEDGETLEQFQEAYLKEKSHKENIGKYGVIVDTIALKLILSSNRTKEEFLVIAKDAESVICCRVSPLQKSEVVKSMKDFNPDCVTLSIGDGGNDVSMIIEAHIGIGIHGEEGVRAIQASDYSMGEFKFLGRLLFYHGRTNYMRVCEMILYFFYKNFVFTMNHFYYTFFNLASGQTIIDDWFISFYNLIFTAFPLGSRACLDQDLRDEDGEVVKKLTPFLYLENKERPLFNIKQFSLCLGRGLVNGLINFIIIYLAVNQTIIDQSGNTVDLWFLSVNLYTGIIMIVSFRLIIVTKYYTWMNVTILLITSWLFYFLFVVLVNVSTSYNSVGTMYVAFNSPKLYLNLILSIGINFLLDLATYSGFISFSNSLTQTLRLVVRERGEFNNDAGAPEIIINNINEYNMLIDESKKKSNAEDQIKPKKKVNTVDLDKIDGVNSSSIKNNINNRSYTNSEKKKINEEKERKSTKGFNNSTDMRTKKKF